MAEYKFNKILAALAMIITILTFFFDLPSKLRSCFESENTRSSKDVNFINSFNETKNYQSGMTESSSKKQNVLTRKTKTTFANVDLTPNNGKNELNEPSKIEIGDYINSTTYSDIAVLIIDDEKRNVTGLSSAVVDLYRKRGYSVNGSLFSDNFVHSQYLKTLESGSSQTIDKFSLSNYVKYIIVGRYSKKFVLDNDLNGKVCNGNLDVSIISCIKKMQIDNFPVSARNFGYDQQHAEKGLFEKIKKDYEFNHINQDNFIK